MEEKIPGKMPEGELSDAIDLAKFYIVSGQYSKAEELLNAILKKQADNKDALFHLGILYELTNELDRAIDMFRAVLDIDPDNKEAEEHLSKLLEM